MRQKQAALLYSNGQDKGPIATDPQGALYQILRVFLIDREGRIRNIYSSGTLDPRLVLADVKTLLLEEARVSRAPGSFHRGVDPVKALRRQ